MLLAISDFLFILKDITLGIVMHACNPSPQEKVEAEGSEVQWLASLVTQSLSPVEATWDPVPKVGVWAVLNPRPREAEADWSLVSVNSRTALSTWQVPGQPELHIKCLSRITKGGTLKKTQMNRQKGAEMQLEEGRVPMSLQQLLPVQLPRSFPTQAVFSFVKKNYFIIIDWIDSH